MVWAAGWWHGRKRVSFGGDFKSHRDTYIADLWGLVLHFDLIMKFPTPSSGGAKKFLYEAADKR